MGAFEPDDQLRSHSWLLDYPESIDPDGRSEHYLYVNYIPSVMRPVGEVCIWINPVQTKWSKCLVDSCRAVRLRKKAISLKPIYGRTVKRG